MSINQINNGDSGLTARGIINSVIDNINNLSTLGTSSYALTALSAETACYITLNAGAGIEINNANTISSRLVTVNGIQPVDGNALVSLTGTITGTSASLVLSSSGDITASINNNTLWIISSDSTPTNNGKTYIFISGPPGQWLPIAPLDTAAADARYLMLGPQSPLTNNLVVNGNVSASSFTGNIQGTSSWATTASNAITASHALNILSPGGSNGQIQYRLSSTQFGGVSSLTFTGGILRATGSFTGSLIGELIGTSSWAVSSSRAITASNALTASFLPTGTYNITASWAQSSSRAITSSYVTGSSFTSTNPALSSSYALTASYALTSAGGTSVTIINNANNNIITATGAANTLNGESNLTFDGSTLAVTGRVTATSFTGSLQGTSSWAASSSRAITASYALVSSGTIENAVTASYALISQISLIQDYEDGGNKSGTGNGETLAAYGYNAGSAASAFPLTNTEWGSISTSTTYDSCVWQEALLMFRDNRKSCYIQSADNKRYIINHRVYIPTTSSLGANDNPYMFGIDGRGCVIKDTRTGAEASGGLFTRYPVTQSSANNFDVEYAIDMQNMRIYGPAFNPALSSSCAIEIGSSKRSYFANLDISRYDIGFRGAMMLNCTMDRINTVFCETAGVKFENGWWEGAGLANTVNQVSLTNCRFNTSLSSSIGLWLQNCDSTYGHKLQFEGASGSYGLYYDSGNITVVKNAYFNNLRFESETKYIKGLIGFKGRDTFSFIAELGWSQQTQTGVYLIETEAIDGTSPIIVLRDWGFGSTSNTWKINNLNSGCAFDITNVRLSSSDFGGSFRGPLTSAEILASSSLYFDGTVPTSNRLRFSPSFPFS